MSAFTGPLLIEEMRPGRRWRLAAPIRYEAGRKGSGLWIEVPAGFVTDGASIPVALRVILAVWGSYGRAAALHDYLYSLIRAGDPREVLAKFTFRPLSLIREGEQHGLWATMPPCASTARRWADREFYLAMRACGTSRPLAWAIWATVRLCGGRYCRSSAGPG